MRNRFGTLWVPSGCQSSQVTVWFNIWAKASTWASGSKQMRKSMVCISIKVFVQSKGAPSTCWNRT